MKPLLTPPGPDAPTVASATVAGGAAETAVPHARTRAPLSVQILRLLLIAATASVIATWLWAWQGVQAYAWPGVDNDITERGLAYLLILAPAVPVNLIAAIRLARGGRRAARYLAAAAALAAVQTVLLLTPSAMPLADTMSDGSNDVGIRHLLTTGPLVFAGLWLATTTRARTWLGAAPRTRRLPGLEAIVWCLALACIVAMGTEVRQWTHTASATGAPAGEYAEPGTWAGLEQAVTETTDAIPGFTGFTTRTLEVQSCEYHTPAGLPTYRYLLTYELRDSATEPGAPEPSAAAPIAARWSEGEFTLTYDGATIDGTRLITAERTFPTEEGRGTYPTATGVHAITLAYTEAPAPTLHLESPCVERATESTECILPQGDPDTDTVNGITCRE
ncbi:hypothetical protein [Glycomyces tritici]|uniref:DUF2637 domain-containing protein n=1 Tax=Glycomyces tritici TaxID=2665176 RepID=A0ABT7YWI7_9ACTN|nr:hypothetical protein [Glycomyces tritici]MDN3242992.1 hypothetical protein [Glycomyces tritici]